MKIAKNPQKSPKKLFQFQQKKIYQIQILVQILQMIRETWSFYIYQVVLIIASQIAHYNGILVLISNLILFFLHFVIFWSFFELSQNYPHNAHNLFTYFIYTSNLPIHTRLLRFWSLKYRLPPR